MYYTSHGNSWGRRKPFDTRGRPAGVTYSIRYKDRCVHIHTHFCLHISDSDNVFWFRLLSDAAKKKKQNLFFTFYFHFILFKFSASPSAGKHMSVCVCNRMSVFFLHTISWKPRLNCVVLCCMFLQDFAHACAQYLKCFIHVFPLLLLLRRLQIQRHDNDDDDENHQTTTHSHIHTK